MVRSSDLRKKPSWLPDWWPWLPDLVPEWSPISPGWTPSDIIPDEPSWWPDWLPWNPLNIKLPSRDINLPRGNIVNNAQIYMQALSIQRALYSLNVQTSNKVASSRRGKSGACCYGARICDKLNTHNTCIDGVYDGECIGSNAKFYEGKKCTARNCCGNYQDVVPSSQYIGEYSKEDCDSDPNTHWMGSSAIGYCMEGAKHSWRQSTATRNLNIRNPNMGY